MNKLTGKLTDIDHAGAGGVNRIQQQSRNISHKRIQSVGDRQAGVAFELPEPRQQKPSSVPIKTVPAIVPCYLSFPQMRTA
jgi:hypothetical protein